MSKEGMSKNILSFLPTSKKMFFETVREVGKNVHIHFSENIMNFQLSAVGHGSFNNRFYYGCLSRLKFCLAFEGF